MKLELISFKLCPFAQRAVILLNTQKLDFELTYINPMDPPDWFKKISPTGQVPLLKVDDKIVFESAVIGEFVNDIGTLDLHPSAVVSKANNRSWIAFSASMFNDLFNIVTGDKEKFDTAKTALFTKLAKVEAVKSDEKFFNDNDFAMIDAAFAPLFMRLGWINEFCEDALSLKEFKKIAAWSEAILSIKTVETSVVEGLDDVYYSNIEAREGHLSTLLID
jgi:glutathione S-transferase